MNPWATEGHVGAFWWRFHRKGWTIRWGSGFGLHCIRRPRSEALFSERYGYTRAYYFGDWRFEVLHSSSK